MQDEMYCMNELQVIVLVKWPTTLKMKYVNGLVCMTCKLINALIVFIFLAITNLSCNLCVRISRMDNK